MIEVSKMRAVKFFLNVLVASFLLPSAICAQGYGKVQSPWFQQGKISGGISVSNLSAATQLPNNSGTPLGLIAWICNTGANDAYIAFGTTNSISATVSASTWLKSGTCGSYDLQAFTTANKYIAAITATSTTTLTVETGIGNPPSQGSGGSSGGPGTISGSITNPTSTLTMTSATTAYSAGQLIANSATAGSVINPSFNILNSAGGATIPRLRLSNNDTTSTAWPSVQIQVDLWTASPTWTNGDRGTWLPLTGAASHLGSYSCVMSTPVWGDGYSAECSPIVGSFASLKLASGTAVFWSLKAATASGITGASKVWTITAELMN